uniref:Integrase core domain containing protein n=1 Tax=Solanum tuberosum TaxID=4113 RepID=M1DJ61_SOLTU
MQEEIVEADRNKDSPQILSLLAETSVYQYCIDIGLIRDEANVAAPRNEPQVEVPPFGDYLVADLEHMHDDDTTSPATIVVAQAPPSVAASQAPRSSRATHSSSFTAIPLARVQKLEAQMATLLQHVQAVHQHLDAFELRVLDRPGSTVDVTILKKELESLRADVIVLLAPLETEQESTPMAQFDDVVMSTLFEDDMPLPNSSHADRKRPHSGHSSDDTEDERLRKRERQQTEVAGRASIVDEEMRQQRAMEISIGPSSGMSTTGGAIRVAESTTKGDEMVDGSATEGILSINPAGSGKLDSPTS